MSAEGLNCTECGAGVASGAPKCDYCGVRVATIACPACFGMLHVGSRYCPHCGELAASWEREETPHPCPRCSIPLLRGTFGGAVLHECERCLGVWIGKTTFEEVCRNQEQQAAVLRSTARPDTTGNRDPGLHYIACPECKELMNRVNFGRCSGVIVDVCRDHGTWFDATELQRIVEFIRADGLGRAREFEKEELLSARRRLAVAQQRVALPEVPGLTRRRHRHRYGDGWLEFVLESAADMLAKWLRR